MHSERETARGGEQGIKEAVEKNGHPWRVEKGKRREGTGTGCQTDFCPNRGCSWSGPPCVMTSAGISPHGGWGWVGGVQLCSTNLPAPPAPTGKTAMLSAGWNRREILLPSLSSHSPLEMLLPALAFQFFAKEENNKREDELRFFYIFTANDHGQETFPSQWLSCGALQSLCTRNQHHRTLPSLCQRLLQGLAWCLLCNGDKHSRYMNGTTCLAPFQAKERQRMSWYVL